MALTLLELVSRDWGEKSIVSSASNFLIGCQSTVVTQLLSCKGFLGFLVFPNLGVQGLASSGMGDAL